MLSMRRSESNRANPSLPTKSRAVRISWSPSRSAYRGGRGFAYNYKFAGEGPDAAGEVRGETESANDTGRRGNSEDSAAPLSLSDGGCHPRDGAPEAHRWREECHHQRVALPGAFSGPADHAGRADYRIHGANGGALAAYGSPGP